VIRYSSFFEIFFRLPPFYSFASLIPLIVESGADSCSVILSSVCVPPCPKQFFFSQVLP